ncbi:hypothetical protein GCM10009122_20300 [Fulvivirga kasyanovii]|uniref:class I SAM-dependent methyltransferase n=1 Tax=Fulvivirga kasyanovii TaxID=396812 RepID=UPI0031D67B2C
MKPVSIVNKLPIWKKLFLIFRILIKHPKRIKFLLGLNFSGFFLETGYFKSIEAGHPVDLEGNPIPWLSYSFLYFIDPRLNSKLRMFEYGSGNSTIYFAKRIKSITSVEHDPNWYKVVRSKVGGNAELHLLNLDETYVSQIQKTDSKFDLILVDGRMRVKCIMESYKYLSEDGVIIVDDSQREKYQEGLNFLLSNGFKKIDFWGASPYWFNLKCTTILYKSSNCLNI